MNVVGQGSVLGPVARVGWRRVAVVAYAAASTAAVFASEGVFVALIAFFARAFGFWPGMIGFTLAWLAAGLGLFVATARLWPERARVADPGELAEGPVRRRITRLARRSRPLGAIAVAWFFGPLWGPPFFRALGYRGRGLLAWVVASGPLCCGFWYTLYAGGFQALAALV